MIRHWDALSRLAGKRFSDPNLADEALLYVADGLEQDGWKRLASFGGKSSFKRFLLQVAARLLEDFSRKKFGRVRPGKWIREKGGIWLALYKLLCLERADDDRAVDMLRHSVPEGRSETFVRQAIIDVRINVPDCGKSTMPGGVDLDVDTLAGSGENTRPATSMEERQRSAVLTLLASLVERDEADCGEELTPLARKLTKAGSGLSLSDEDRLLLKLIYWEGMNVSAAGRAMHWSASKTHSRLARVLEQIGDAFRDVAVFDEIRSMTEK